MGLPPTSKCELISCPFKDGGCVAYRTVSGMKGGCPITGKDAETIKSVLRGEGHLQLAEKERCVKKEKIRCKDCPLELHVLYWWGKGRMKDEDRICPAPFILGVDTWSSDDCGLTMSGVEQIRTLLAKGDPA